MFTPRLQKLYVPNVIETLPGDAINEGGEQFARTQPMVAPTFTKINADQHAFFVPNWQLNEHFDDFITAGEDGTYQGKMPWMKSGNIYLSIFNCFSWLANNTVTADYYNAQLERLQSVIEHIDLMRSVPFVLPDFVLATTATLSTVKTANMNAFTSLNSKFANTTLRINMLPFGSVLKVWSEYFRDENLQEDLFKIYWKGEGMALSIYDTIGEIAGIGAIIGHGLTTASTQSDFEDYINCVYALFGAKNRAWKKDYFTAALPFTQKGPDVLLPLYGTFPVEFSGPSTGSSSDPAQNPGRDVYFHGGNSVNAPGVLATNAGATPASGFVTGQVNLNASGLGTTITDVRRAFRLEEMEEADARGGNRYPENTLMQFGVRTPDSRLPRSQFLGSNTSPVQVSEVVQNSASVAGQSPQGTLAGKGISYGSNRLCRQYFTMHGFLLNFYSLRTKAVYEPGIHPMFSRYDRTEYAWPRFANLGEQPVYDKELYVDGSTTEDGVFGYEPRYSEYKSEKSSVHGLLKGSLNYWTMSRRFASQPQLSEEFITNSPRLDNFAVVNKLQPPFIVEIDYRVRSNRKLPYFGVPMI